MIRDRASTLLRVDHQPLELLRVVDAAAVVQVGLLHPLVGLPPRESHPHAPDSFLELLPADGPVVVRVEPADPVLEFLHRHLLVQTQPDATDKGHSLVALPD
ncbi:hypothetical protein NL676_022950 [Syzygium grande]|nr:hypothetical protein NL676_022950 [Syzygium grande]